MASRKVMRGIRINCEMAPTIAALGFRARFLKCRGFSSSATPNMIKAMVRFRIRRLSGLKFNLRLSRALKVSSMQLEFDVVGT
jgi:hypothetical protein